MICFNLKNKDDSIYYFTLSVDKNYEIQIAFEKIQQFLTSTHGRKLNICLTNDKLLIQ